jgi:hypothetical protein
MPLLRPDGQRSDPVLAVASLRLVQRRTVRASRHTERVGKGNPEIRVRARPAARKRWERAASERGECLSEFVRRAADERASRQPDPGVTSPSVAPHASSARAIPLEERLAGITELVDGLGSGR